MYRERQGGGESERERHADRVRARRRDRGSFVRTRIRCKSLHDPHGTAVSVRLACLDCSTRSASRRARALATPPAPNPLTYYPRFLSSSFCLFLPLCTISIPPLRRAYFLHTVFLIQFVFFKPFIPTRLEVKSVRGVAAIFCTPFQRAHRGLYHSHEGKHSARTRGNVEMLENHPAEKRSRDTAAKIFLNNSTASRNLTPAEKMPPTSRN